MRACRCSGTTPGSTTASTSTSRCATSSPSRARSRTRRCGWRARSWRRSAWPACAGMGALGFQFVSAEAAQAWVHAYYNAFTKRARHAVRLRRPTRTSPSCRSSCARRPTRRRGRGPTARRSSSSPSATTPATRPGVPGEIKLWEEYLAFRETPKGQAHAPSAGSSARRTTIRERLRKFEESNVDQVILLNQAGKNTHDDICSSLELFAAEVMPEFHDREPEHQEWKQRRPRRRHRARGDRHRRLRRTRAVATAAPAAGRGCSAGARRGRRCRPRRRG